MEEDPFCAPRLARDYFLDSDGWETSLQTLKHCGASDPHEDGQASRNADIYLQAANLQQASDPTKQEGKASSTRASDPTKQEGQASSTRASDPPPKYKGQASNDAEISLHALKDDGAPDPQDGQAPSTQASDVHISGQATSSQTVNSFHFAANSNLQATSFQAASDHKRQAAPSSISITLAASSQETSALAAPSSLIPIPAIPGTSPSHLHRLHLATLSSSTTSVPSSPLSAIPTTDIPSSTCMNTCIFMAPSVATSPMPANPASLAATPLSPCSATLVYALAPLPLHASTISIMSATPAISPAIPVLATPTASPPSRWRDEVYSSSLVTNTSPPGGSSRLRAMAMPWKPGKPTLPSLLVGDIPLSPKLGSSTTPSQPLLLPGTARQPLAPTTHPVENLGDGQHSCCSYCGQTPHLLPGGSNSASPFTFSRLRGESMKHQAQEVKASTNQQVAAQRSSRPRWKMKAELKAFQTHKANLDPG